MHKVKEYAKKYDERLEKIGIKYNPFSLRAPEEETLQKVFTNREKEIENTISVIEGGRNALLYGYYGIGKTAFLKYFLYDIAGLEDPKVASIYTTFTGTSETDFIDTVAFALAKQFKDEYQPAKDTYEKMRGIEKTKEHARTMEAGISAVFKAGGRYMSMEGETFKTSLLPVYTKDFIKETLNTMSKKYRILIGVDEIDKMNPRDFNKLIARTRDVLGYNASFMFTGSYTFLSLAGTVISTQYGAFDVKTELPTMSKKDLKESAVKYSRLAGKTCPFTDEALEHLAEQSMGVPRVMMVLCRGAVEYAAAKGLKKIDRGNIDITLTFTGESIYNALLPTQKKVVEYILSIGGGIESVTDKVSADIGVTKARVYSHLTTLMSKDAIIEIGKNGEKIWRLNTALESYMKSRKRVGK